MRGVTETSPFSTPKHFPRSLSKSQQPFIHTVPDRVWAGLTDRTDAGQVRRDLIDMEQALLVGVRDLPSEDVGRFVDHVMDRQNWAKKINYRKKAMTPPPDLNEIRRQAAAAAEAKTTNGGGVRRTTVPPRPA